MKIFGKISKNLNNKSYNLKLNLINMNIGKYIIIFYKLIKILLLSPLIILIIIIYPIVRIKIFEIETRAIGHMSLPMEIFASEIKEKIHNCNRTIYLWFPNKKIANYFLFSKWKQKFIILPRVILEPIYLFFKSKNIKFGNKFLIPYRHWNRNKSAEEFWQDKDLFDVLIKTKPNISFSKNEIEKGNKYLNNFGINLNDPYVIFFFRTPDYYLKNKSISDYKINLRDQVSFNYYESINYLNSINYKTFLLGENYKINKKINNLIYYNKSKDKSDFLDVFLPFNCKFMVSSASGISTIPIMNRRKVLYINFSELYRHHHIDSKFIPFYIPKKFRSISSGTILTYSEVLKLNLSEFTFQEELKKTGFEIIENTKDEILDAIKEMDYFLKHGKSKEDDTDDIQEKFNETYFNKFHYKIKYTKICSSFLKKNRDLFY
tara:strand:+ start:4511 stop:5809 length:1299 start_codon:yes stop_codon:yes gene_type:complete